MSRSTSLGVLAALTLALAGACNDRVPTAETAPAFTNTAPPILDAPVDTTQPTQVTDVPAYIEPWAFTAEEHRGQDGARIIYQCPAGGTTFPVWGTETYTDDSSVCTAAVHAGLITVEDGGFVTIEVRPGEDSYAGNAANEITSGQWGTWPGSFVFAG